MIRELAIHHHLGLGDHFDCNGMVRYILKNFVYDKIYVFSKSNYFNMIEYMYRDTDCIEVIKIDKDLNESEQVATFLRTRENPVPSLRIGFENYPSGREIEDNKNCWEYFYEEVNIPPEVRTSYFYVERDEEAEAKLLEELNPEGKPYIFVHDDPERGMVLTRLDPRGGIHVIRNDNSKNIFHFLKILEDAEEIHCMESSFKSLIDIYAKTAGLFYHDLRGHPLGDKTNREWDIINYAEGVKPWSEDTVAKWHKYSSSGDPVEKHHELFSKWLTSTLSEGNIFIFDIGCGPAWILNSLSYYDKYVGIDINRKCLQNIRKLKDHKTSFHLADIEEILAPEVVADIEYCNICYMDSTLTLLEDPKKVLKEILLPNFDIIYLSRTPSLQGKTGKGSYWWGGMSKPSSHWSFSKSFFEDAVEGFPHTLTIDGDTIIISNA